MRNKEFAFAFLFLWYLEMCYISAQPLGNNGLFRASPSLNLLNNQARLLSSFNAEKSSSEAQFGDLDLNQLVKLAGNLDWDEIPATLEQWSFESAPLEAVSEATATSDSKEGVEESTPFLKDLFETNSSQSAPSNADLLSFALSPRSSTRATSYDQHSESSDNTLASSDTECKSAVKAGSCGEDIVQHQLELERLKANGVDASILKRYRNTLAARRSRARKVQQLDHFENKAKALESENRELEARVAAFEQERMRWYAREAQMLQLIESLQKKVNA